MGVGSNPTSDKTIFSVQSLYVMMIFLRHLVNVRMAEWSKAPDSRHSLAPSIGSAKENSGPRMRAWVQIPLLTNYFPPIYLDASVAQ